MIRIEQLKVPYLCKHEQLVDMVCKKLHVTQKDIEQFQIKKKSVDARKKPDIYAVYTVDVKLGINESKAVKAARTSSIKLTEPCSYTFKPCGTQPLSCRPVIVGTGPAGLFCGYMLAEHGYRPILLERGQDVDTRRRTVEEFWAGGDLLPQSNVQFGEGGAGTFSDGKLNTLIKDKDGRGRKVLELLVQHGAPEDILYLNKPHIGTDILSKVVKNLRNEIIRLGGEVRFNGCLTDIHTDNGKITSVTVEDSSCSTSGSCLIKTELLILAIGHSARDTFSMLHSKGVPMESKSFAVGVRIEHPQAMIDNSQYGEQPQGVYPAADYKLAETLPSGRGVYSFCMCPGGYVVNASSEPGRLAVNGMSYHDRGGTNSNSAIIVTVSKDDFESGHPLAGVEFQRKLEVNAYTAGKSCIPVQLFGDFCHNRISTAFGEIHPQIKGDFRFGDIRSALPKEVGDSIESGIKAFDRKIKGFAREDAVLSGIESRTSSPVRITRNDSSESEIKGLYPCGEGAGYAGGITSAAMDGIKTAEAVASLYHPFD